MEPKNKAITREMATKTNFIFALAIVQEGLILEIEESMRKNNSFRFLYKQKVNIIKKNAGDLRAIINQFDPENAEKFGDESEKIERFLYGMLK